MQAGASPARRTRAQHRHELLTLTYVTLDGANGGIVRNLTHAGVAVQAVAAVRPGRQLQVRFELRGPRLRVETRGEVVWATPSGQCGIRFLDVSPRMTRHIDEWIFGSLLTGLPPHLGPDELPVVTRSLTLVASANDNDKDEAEADGLMVSSAPVKVIELSLRAEAPQPASIRPDGTALSIEAAADPPMDLDWLLQPLSGRSLTWTVNTLAVLAALLLFVLVFLSVTREPPRRPFAMTAGAALLVAALYWGFFKVFGGGSPGARLARLRESSGDGGEDRDARFR
jgi:PilZ domain-containing protein